MIGVREYLTADGISPHVKWFNTLNGQAAAKVATAVTRITQGNLATAKSVGAGVQECRIDFGPGYRIYFGRDGDRMMILFGEGTKKRQQDDIQHAQALCLTTGAAGKRRSKMLLTRDFKETIRERARRDAAFREALLKEAVDALLSGDMETGKIVLRDYINVTVGFDKLGNATKKSPKSLMRMLGPKGNRQAAM